LNQFYQLFGMRLKLQERCINNYFELRMPENQQKTMIIAHAVNDKQQIQRSTILEQHSEVRVAATIR
jgi:hypothetical protein